MLRQVLLTVAAAAAVAGNGRADDKPVDRAELDRRAHKVAYHTVVTGTAVFNGGDHAGCLKLYEGALPALAEMLDHRPELVQVIAAQSAEAGKLATAKDKAFALRKALDAVIAQTGGKAMKKPLWDRLGGEAGVRAVVQEFLATAAKDPKVNVDRNGNYPLTKERGERVGQLLIEFVSSVTGGPLKYTGRDMKNSHAGMKITEDEFNAAAGHLIAALKKYNVPQAEIDELVGLVAGTAKDLVEVKK